MEFKGSIVAIVTPFRRGTIDTAALEKLVKWHVSEGTHGIVVNGTTGEAPTLSHEEQEINIRTTLKAADGNIPVIAGVGSNNTSKTIDAAVRAEKLGVNGILVVVPYYNKPVQEGLFQHFSAVAKSVKIPLIVYNVPGRTSASISVETIARLTKFKNISAIKDATGDMKYAQELSVKLGSRISILSGDDIINLPLASIGSCGAISVVANVVPNKMSEMYNSFFNGDFKHASDLHLEMLDLHKGLFVESNPIPVKAALNMMGKIGPEIRLPLTRLPEDKMTVLKEILKRHGAIK